MIEKYINGAVRLIPVVGVGFATIFGGEIARAQDVYVDSTTRCAPDPTTMGRTLRPELLIRSIRTSEPLSIIQLAPRFGQPRQILFSVNGTLDQDGEWFKAATQVPPIPLDAGEHYRLSISPVNEYRRTDSHSGVAWYDETSFSKEFDSPRC